MRLDALLSVNPDQPVDLFQVCVRLGVAERTLRAMCKDALGISPARYMKRYRLQLARAALQDCNRSGATVTSIAMEHGFFELGRFAAAYRAEFGEYPSETLREALRTN